MLCYDARTYARMHAHKQNYRYNTICDANTQVHVHPYSNTTTRICTDLLAHEFTQYRSCSLAPPLSLSLSNERSFPPSFAFQFERARSLSSFLSIASCLCSFPLFRSPPVFSFGLARFLVHTLCTHVLVQTDSGVQRCGQGAFKFAHLQDVQT